MAVSPQFLEELRARTGLSDVVARRVKLQRRGREHVGLCPFHNEKTPSFTVSDEKGFFHCFGCGAHGDAVGFAMRTDGLSFLEAVEKLAAEAGLQVPVATPEEREREQRRAGLLDVTEAACAFYEEILQSSEGRAAREYLERRGLSAETVARFRLGFAPPGNRLKSRLAGAEMPEALLVEAGLLRRPDDGRGSYDFFRERVIFPIADQRGRIIAFGGRTMGDGEPKYLNSPDTPLFDKRRTLYGLALARRAAQERRRVIVVEGYMDVIALSQAGFSETVAPLGTALTEGHIHLLWRYAPEPVLCFDGDAAGGRAASRAAERALAVLKPGRSLRFAALPAGEDPDSLVRSRGGAALEAQLEQAAPLDAMIWSLETEGRSYDTPERLAGLDKRLEDRARSIDDRKVQHQYISLFRSKLRELGFWRRGPQEMAAPSALRAGAAKSALGKRHDQILLAATVNHPELLDAYAEDLAMIEISDPELDNLLKEILEIHAVDSDLDSSALRTQLNERGKAEILSALLCGDVYVHGRFARDGAEWEDVRDGFGEALRRRLAPVRRSEFEEELNRFAEEPTSENWERFERLKADAQTGGPMAQVVEVRR